MFAVDLIYAKSIIITMSTRFIMITILGIIALLVIAFFTGPIAPQPALNTELPTISGSLEQVEARIRQSEDTVSGLKPDNEARIVWADGYEYQPSPYSLVYLHGFSASQGEGDPIHREFASRYGCNMYLSRLYGHGLDVAEPLKDMTPENLMESAQEAIAIGNRIGEKVIVMSTSTGGTLALYLASGNPELAGLICYSPNIDLFDSTSELLVGPWGMQLARLVIGGNYRTVSLTDEEAHYWQGRYRIESLVALKALVKATMKEEVFKQIEIPVFLGYYYKDQQYQDSTVSVPRMLEMFEQLGTPKPLKKKIAFPEVSSHVIASKYSSEDLESVRKATFEFAEETLGLSPLHMDTTSYSPD